MKNTKIEKVVQFKSCNNNDIANAVISLSEPMLIACGNDNDIKEMIITLAITGWNLSLFQETEVAYKQKINEKIPKSLTGDEKEIFSGFVLQIIKKKKAEFEGMKKGITEHTVKFDDNTINLEVKSLPVNPKQA